MKLKNLCKTASNCAQCPLHESRTNVVFGEGPENADIMLVGEGPGEKEDETGRPFIGRSGKLLTDLIHQAGMDRQDIYITSIVKCRPENNRMPRKSEYETCIDLYLNRQIKLINPKIIGMLGNSAIYALTRQKSVTKIHGNVYEVDGRKYMALFHPAAALRFRKFIPMLKEDLLKLKNLI